MRTAIPLVFVTFPLGCGGADDSAGAPPTESDTSGPAPGLACEEQVSLTHGEGGCFGSDYAWEFKADVAGCASEAVLNVWRTDGEPWDEQHPLGVLSEGPDKVWQAYYALLTHQAPRDGWVPGSTTALDCQLDTGKVTFAVRVFDTSGAIRSCAVWGHDPELVIAGGASDLHGDPPASFASCESEPW